MTSRNVFLVVLSAAALLGKAAARDPLLLKPGPRPNNTNYDTCVKEIEADCQKAASQGSRLLFIGDSILEALRDSSACRPCDNSIWRTSCTGVHRLFEQRYGRYNASVLAIAAEQVANIEWRLATSCLPTANKAPVVVLLAGTNDLGAVASATSQARADPAQAMLKAAPGVATRMGRVLKLLRTRLPRANIVVVGLLPRGTTSNTGLRPYTLNDPSWPSIYTKSIDAINTRLKALTTQDNTGRLHYLDCGKRIFLTKDRKQINLALMPDTIHPSLAGYNLLLPCIDSAIQPLL